MLRESGTQVIGGTHHLNHSSIDNKFNRDRGTAGSG
jgi:hypothetical protein